jgi:ankyrin repeat protein
MRQQKGVAMLGLAARLKKRMDAEAVDCPLLNAVRRGDAAALAAHIAAGEDVEQCSPNDFRNPLALAFATGRLDLVKMLLKAGANPDAPSRHGPVSLFAACYPKGSYSRQKAMADSAEGLKLLAKHGANLGLAVVMCGMSRPVGEMLARAAAGK